MEMDHLANCETLRTFVDLPSKYWEARRMMTSLVGEEVQRLSVIHSLPFLLSEDEPQCMHRVVPKVQQVLPNASAEFHLAASSTFLTILEKKLVHPRTFTQTFLQSILSSIDSRDPVEIRRHLIPCHKHICFTWMRGHSGTTGNERTDELAKSAAVSNFNLSSSLCPYSYVKRKINEHIMNSRGLTLKEPIDIIESDDTPNNVENIFIEPLAVHIDSDEDSGDDGSCLVDNRMGCQLSSGAEIVLSNNEHVGRIDYDLPSSSVPPPLNIKKL
ncbi:hypothetical protein ANN_04721 [Periplaneta americana]|uniref:RNase H type-1 domain-containing protein n=1 Tax=Periplaneta americana TaxID=6978 RepID=A0ABQ8TAR7_PERAM|nr:hypothetical protein ANN_04721 [Periplaneta americana]